MAIQIPDLLAERLQQAPSIESSVRASLERFEPWLIQNGMPFFPEFTDHGPRHIETVLGLAELLIRQTELNTLPQAFTPPDAGVLVLSVLLHDIGMHLTEDGFLALLTRNDERHRIGELDNRSWPDLWNEYYAEATRWDDRTLEDHFGTALQQRGDGSPLVRRPETVNVREWAELDRRLIGEFVRRHHPRLAHEIAISGVPGPTPDRLKLVGDNTTHKLHDLAGFIARSHGSSLRQFFTYLDEKYGSYRHTNETHPIFLMALLRLADYLDLYAERAPNSVRLTKRLRSPRSRQEWDAHQAIEDIVLEADNDPELLRLHVRPHNVETYLRIREWQDGLQSELDQSWAVLGEVYGRFQKFSSLGLKIRRVTSNLDQSRFTESLGFLPERISFGLARAEVLALMVKPLYGDDPAIGIRELIQNAVDAVRELQDLQSRHDELRNLDLRQQGADVEVKIDHDSNDQPFLEVIDRGVGMTAETIKDYLLKAGASFRDSPSWKREFLPAEGSSTPTVLRAGRFGVGLFAAFLLGDEIEVVTRHYTQPRDAALAFRARPQTEAIEIKKTQEQIGTRIRISLNKATYDRLAIRPSAWQWYRLSAPSISYFLDKAPVSSEDDAVPSPEHILPPDWHKLATEDDVEVLWCQKSDQGGVTLNGFAINTHGLDPFSSDLTSELKRPTVAIFDPAARIPIDLTRARFTQQPGFAPKLQEELRKNFLALLLAQGPDLPPSSPSNLLRSLGRHWLGSLRRRSTESYTEESLVLLKKGFTIPDSRALLENEINHLIVIGEDLLYVSSDEELLHEPEPMLVTEANQGWFRIKKYYPDDRNPVAWIEEVFADELHWLGRDITGVRFLGRGPVRDEDIRSGPFRSAETLFGGPLRVQRRCDGWYSLESGDPGPSAFSEAFMLHVENVLEAKERRHSFNYGSLPPFLGEFYLQSDGDRLEFASRATVRLWSLWCDILHQPYIPYSQQARANQLRDAYAVLREYVDEHLKS